MAYTYTKKKEPYLTAADRKRIADLDNNPAVLHRKFKACAVIVNNKSKVEVWITCYGKDKDELAADIKEHLSNFQKTDKNWKLLKVNPIKGETEDQAT